MRHLKYTFFLLALTVLTAFSPTSTNINKINDNGYSVKNFYKRIDLDYGTLDENGLNIDYIFTTTSIDAGIYEITLSDGPGNLYKINGTDLYIIFYSYFGYAGYGTNCLLKVTYNSATVFKTD